MGHGVHGESLHGKVETRGMEHLHEPVCVCVCVCVCVGVCVCGCVCVHMNDQSLRLGKAKQLCLKTIPEKKKSCLRWDSNPQHSAYQADALPTEPPRQLSWAGQMLCKGKVVSPLINRVTLSQYCTCTWSAMLKHT